MPNRFHITEARKEQTMTKACTAATHCRQLANELESGEAVGKIDWTKFMELIMQLLPLIIALFAEEKPTAE